ncbi:Uncharacterised protein [Acholeplasma oculi]|uniref:Uncharacterized protein n=1 Tax=Acholeplasma oculi TaxID=35623 RepID=A0A061AAY3_9MOLU|nr:hypothetical protein [Acholeplasma oculi]CDR30559.1 hypothetical protein Aocu_04860 [Acholeplasma oculi]SKC47102.1 hypothetical protein SAMN02745122_1265 [Acholeplasma oculi]SUT89241.1 Uncharacterised protein [Acholeplasma oculi]
MIKSIEINNYKSIREKITITLDPNHPRNFILPVKPGLTKDFMEIFVLIKTIYQFGLRRIPRLDHHEHVSLQITFEVNQKSYRYKLILNLTKGEIDLESLSEIKSHSEINLFHREMFQIDIESTLSKRFKGIDLDRFKTYLYDLRYERRELILSKLHVKDFSESSKLDFFDEITKDLMNIESINLNQHVLIFEDIKTKQYEKVLEVIKYLELPIHNILFKEVDLDDLRSELNRHRYDDLMDEIRNLVTNSKEINHYIWIYQHLYRIKGTNLNDLRFYTLNIESNVQGMSDFNQLSLDLKELLIYIFVVFRYVNSKTICIENMTKHIPYNVAKKLLIQIKKHLEVYKNQIIFTSMDYLLFDQGILDQKELYILDYDQTLKLNSISELGIRKDKKLINLFTD